MNEIKIEFTNDNERDVIIMEQTALGNEENGVFYTRPDLGNPNKQVNFIKFKTGADAIELKKDKARTELDNIDAVQFMVMEELIEMLIQKGIISFSDFSSKAKQLHQRRKILWEELNK